MSHIMLVAPGSSIHTKRFLQMLLADGHRVTLVDWINPIPQGAQNYAFVRYPRGFRLSLVRGRFATICLYLIGLLQFRLLWLRLKPDVVHVHFVDYRAVHCAHAHLHPLVLTCWGGDINVVIETDKQPVASRQDIAWTLSQADHITADSQALLDRCEQITNTKLPTSIFYFGIDVALFKPDYRKEAMSLRERLGIPPDAKTLVSVRSMRVTMGHHFVVEAFAKIAHEPQCANAVLVFYRYVLNDDYEQRILALVQNLGIEDKVYWLEPVAYDQLPIHYTLADFIIIYASSDGFPVTFFEVSAARRPIIASDLPDYLEVYGEDAVRYVPAENAEALANAFRECLTGPTEPIQKRVEEAYQIALNVGEQTQAIKRIEKVYDALITSV